MALGDRIRKRREQLSMSQYELARRAGIAQPTISALERGRKADVTSTVLKRLAEALSCTTDYLVGMYEKEDELQPATTALVSA
jgi:transcriptional regulator with XRE-family HTH domain